MTVRRGLADMARQKIFDVVGIGRFSRTNEALATSIIWFGVAFQVIYVGAFAYFWATNFQNTYWIQQFVAVDPASGNCNAVPRPWTIPLITADYDGFWEGQKGFSPNHGQYLFNLYAFQGDNATYTSWLQKMETDITRVGKLAEGYDLALNLLIWASYQHTESTVGKDGIMQDQTLSFDADAQSIMWTDIISGTVSDEDSDCPEDLSDKVYNRATGVMTMTFDMSNFNANPSCVAAINPVTLGYDERTDGDSFTFEMDVHTLYAALVVSYDINGQNSLALFTKIDRVFEGVMYGNEAFNVDRYYDSQNPSMDPMFCIGRVSEPLSDYNCVLPAGNTYGVPFLRQGGASDTSPVPCNCSDASGASQRCDKFDFLAGVIVYDGPANQTVLDKYPVAFQPFIPAMEFFYQPPEVGVMEANDAVFKMAWIAANGAKYPDPQYTNKTFRRQQYDWSDTPSFGSASIVMFHLTSETDRSINFNNRQLFNGACSDTFTSANFSHFYGNTWGPLQEDYYQCTQLLQDAFFNAVGIAQGTASLLTPLIMLVAIFIAVRVKAWMQKPGGRRAAAAVAPASQASDGSMHAPIKGYPSSYPSFAAPSLPADVEAAQGSVSRAEHERLRMELKMVKDTLNRYEALWGWEKPF